MAMKKNNPDEVLEISKQAQEIQRKIDNLQKDIASYNTPTKQDKLKEL